MLDNIVNNLSNVLGQQSNQYALSIDSLTSVISILSIQSNETIDRPWRYTIEFTSTNKSIAREEILTRSAIFSFLPVSLSSQLLQQVKTLSSLNMPAEQRDVYGVITQFSQLSISLDEARYQVVLEPRLALLDYGLNSAIYQNQSVVSVVESVLRSHGLTGVDYRLELADSYPSREYICQWQESDLAFILRLLADVGIRLTFETSSEHSCDVIVLSDNEKGYSEGGTIGYTQPGGMVDLGTESIWDVGFISKTVEQSVSVKEYNYRDADNGLKSSQNSVANDVNTHGNSYRYGEHYKTGGDSIDGEIESGSWYAKIRHQAHISEQMVIQGKSNHYPLSPGQIVHISGSPLSGIDEGVIILSVAGKGNRQDSYEVSFTAIPYDVLKPYRPKFLPWPVMNSTLPARVTSPDNDTYGYIDTQGRYRVKMNFDLANWKAGEESLWVRLARPYAGSTYGFHFPLIDGTEVAIAFTDGNPDRPYIAYSLHDSTHPDLVTTENKHRNVIRTPANNKLRMDDKRGQEHIKLATEYGKTQLNVGHLVDSNKEIRGEGFELRTDEWGAVRAAKGLYITTYAREKASNASMDTKEADQLLESAQQLTQDLSKRAASHRAASLSSTVTFNSFLNYTETTTQTGSKKFAAPGMVFASPKGIAHVTPDSIYNYAQQNLLLTSGKDLNIATGYSMHTSVGDNLSMFVRNDIKLFSGGGKIQAQAHNNDIEIIADKTLRIVSNEDKVSISAKKEIIIACGGAYIRLADGNIEIHAPGQIEHKAQQHPFSGPKSRSPTLYSFPEQKPLEPYLLQFVIQEVGSDKPLPGVEYQIMNQDEEIVAEGVTDGSGMTQIVDSEYSPETFKIYYKKGD